MVNRQETMGCESVDMVRFDLGTLLQGQMRIAKIESAYNSLMTFGPLLQGQMRTAKLKSAYNSLSVPQGTLLCVWESFWLRRLRILFSL